jgi:predicted NAD/FAD-dependent oxidoreductase
VGPYVFDTGATSISSEGRAIDEAIHSLPSEDLIPITLPVYLHENLRPKPGDKSRARIRYTYGQGINHFAKLLAKDLDVRLQTTISKIERAGTSFEIEGEDFTHLVLTPPIPQTNQLLWGLGESRPFANVRYRSCLSVMLGYEAPLPTTPYFALLDSNGRHPMLWLSLESAKAPHRAPEGGSAMVVQMSPSYTLSYYQHREAEIVDDAAGFVSTIFGSNWRQPAVSDVMRWKYSQPEVIAPFELVNEAGSSIVVASDGIAGGRLEEAYDVGAKAARLILAG